MKLLSKEELDKLRNAGLDDLARRWQGLEQKCNSGDTVTIANTGRVNSGKSTLFNALLDRRRFDEGAVRTTITGEREALQDGIELLDTPGTQATEEDDEAAFQAVVEADLIVFVHNSKEPLDRFETAWLERLGGDIGTEQIADRLIFVCSWLDKGEKVANYDELQESLRRQIHSALGSSVDLWEVSAMRYFNGMERQKQGLVKASRIPEFREHLIHKAELARAELSHKRQEQLARLAEETETRLGEQRSALIRERESRREAVERSYLPMFRYWEQTYESFKSYRKRAKDQLNNVRQTYQLQAGAIGEWGQSERRNAYHSFENMVNLF